MTSGCLKTASEEVAVNLVTFAIPHLQYVVNEVKKILLLKY